MPAKAVILLVFLFTLAACNKKGEEGVNVRVYNNSPFTIDKVQIQPGGAGNNSYLDVAPQAYSDYQPFPFTYRYAGITVHIADDSLQVIPIDYVGEEPYQSGNYTFRLTVGGTDEPKDLSFEFLQD